MAETGISADDTEVKMEAVVNVSNVEGSPEATDQLMAYFSSWMKLKVSVAQFFRLKGLLLEKWQG